MSPLRYVIDHVLDKNLLAMTDIGKARIEHDYFMKEVEKCIAEFEERNCAQSIKECREIYPTIRVMGTDEKSQPPWKISRTERNAEERVAKEEAKQRLANPQFFEEYKRPMANPSGPELQR